MNAFDQVLRAVRLHTATPVARAVPLWITPALLTGVRAVLIIPIVLLLRANHPFDAAILYLVAAFTDAVDGEIARLRAHTSPLGALLDPVVDKALNIAIFFIFFQQSPLLTAIIISLDVLLLCIGALHILFPRSQYTRMGANVFGKWKFIFQVFSIVFLIAFTLNSSSFIAYARTTALILACCFAALSFVAHVLDYTRVQTKK